MAENKQRPKTKPSAGPESQLLTLEQHQRRHHTCPAVVSGVKALMGWPAGKQVTDEEYKAAVAKFLNPRGGK